MKWSGYALAALGLAATIYLLVHFGLADVLHSFALAGWGMLFLIPFHLLPLALDTVGWRVLLIPFDRKPLAPTGFLLWVASVREAVSRLLPVASIGGDVLGLRLIVQRGVNGPAGAASVAVEIWVNLIAQYLLTGVAVVYLLLASGAGDIAGTLAAGLLFALPVLAAFALVLARARLFERLAGLIVRLRGRPAFLPSVDSAVELDRCARRLLADARTMGVAVTWQFGGKLVASFELLVASHLIGQPITVGEAVALEGLVEGVRFLAFFVPAGLGVQEAGFVFFGQLLHIDAETALALSLIRRVRELGFGLPVLASWQWREIRFSRRRA